MMKLRQTGVAGAVVLGSLCPHALADKPATPELAAPLSVGLGVASVRADEAFAHAVLNPLAVKGLLIKYLDCNDKLSVQVHPDDELAMERHDSFGKTEAWYVVDCKPGAAIYLGFKDLNITREEYISAVAESRLEPLLNRVEVHPGDVFFIPAGTVHALGAGIEVVEVQQTSDITYRIYDWDRVDAEGKGRELHTALAVDAIDFEADAELLHRRYDLTSGGEAKVIESPYFTMVMHDVVGEKELDRAMIDSFVIYIAIKGDMSIVADGVAETLKEGEVVLIPAEMSDIRIEGTGRVMEVYIGK